MRLTVNFTSKCVAFLQTLEQCYFSCDFLVIVKVIIFQVFQLHF